MKICILGFGGISKSHLRGYLASEAAGSEDKLVAVCDINPKQFVDPVKMNIDSGSSVLPEDVHTYTDWEEMIDTEQPDIVDICLPTYMHCEYTCKVLEKGCNVQCEKPMGLTKAECEKMLATAKRTGKKLMVGMCLRFEPLYLELKAMVEDGRFGRVRSAFFERLSALPRWGYECWFPDVSRSGGVAYDMHIHDVDIIPFIFGEPEAVSATVAGDEECACRSIHSNFLYPDKIVTAIGEWGMSDGWKFSMAYRVNFDHATVVSDTAGVITVYPDQGESYVVNYDKKKRMQEQQEYFASVVRGMENTISTPESAMASVMRVEKLLESAAKNGEKVSL